MGNQQSGTQQQGQQRPGSAARGNNEVQYSSTQSNGTGTATMARKPNMTEVILNVYEPAKGQSGMPGFGIFHTGIEVNGTEYSFAGSPDAGSGTGVLSQVPRATPAGGEWKFKQSISLGFVQSSREEFDRILRELSDAFPANTYDLVYRNCNHFTTAVAKRLGLEKNYPSWVNRAASWGQTFTPMPKHLQGVDLSTPMPKPSVFESTKGYRLDGSAAVGPAAAGKKGKDEKKKETEKKSVSSNSSSSSGSTSARKNPWADPNFIPPGMRKDPVVATGKVDI